jgi:hypothetical protein
VKCYYTSFATHNYGGALDTQKKLSNEALTHGGVDRTILYRENDIPHFISRVDKLFSGVNHVYKRFRHSRYFTWKPHVILKTFNQMSHGDYVIYHDAGRQCYNYKINRELRSFCDYVTEYHKGLFVNFSGWRNCQHTKRECFEVMECDSDYYINHNQCNASWGYFQKNAFVTKFLNDWKRYCLHESLIITDNPHPDGNPEYPEFIEHRHDQSILTNLLLKYSVHNNLKLDPKMTTNKIKKPWGFEKDMCNTISKIQSAFGI